MWEKNLTLNLMMTKNFRKDVIMFPEEKTTKLSKEELKNRRKELYELIKHNSLIENRKTTQEEICEKIDGYNYVESNSTNDHCTAIWNDINKINNDSSIDVVIITKRYKYWIGSKEETKEFLRKLWKDLSPRLKRYWFFVKKIGFDAQGSLFDEKLNPVNFETDDSATISGMLFHKFFIKYDEAMKKESENK